jgi:hypothetical protein
MTDTAIGFAIVGIGMLTVLGVVYIVFSRTGPSEPTSHPPTGVHLPSPSFLPVVLSVGAALIGAGFVFHPEGQVANLFLTIPGLLVFVGGCVWWVRAAGREWHDVESGGSHGGAHADESPGPH